MKVYESVVSIQWYGNNISAESKEDYVKKLKEQFYEMYNVELLDDEIGEIEEVEEDV